MVIGEYLRGSLFAGRRDGVWSLHPAVEFLYIEDLVKGLCALAFCERAVGAGPDPEESGIYNLAGEADATKPLREYVEEIREICGGKGICHYGKLPPNAEGQANLIPDIQKVKEKTGWRPEVGFKDGIRRMIRC